MAKKTMTASIAVLLVLLIGAGAAWAKGQKEDGKPAVRPVINMFMSNSGVPHPTGVDPSDNWAIKVVEDYANVDLKIEVPAYQDFATKLNLLLASGVLPDIVHSFQPNDMSAAADNGAFLDLKPLYDKSAQMQKIVSPIAMDLARSTGGKYYAIPMVTTGYDAGRGNFIQYNQLLQYNGGKYPETVEEYVAYLKWIKQNIPDSIPLISRNQSPDIFKNQEGFFQWYGVPLYGNRVQDGKVVSNIRLPEMKEAVKLHRQLFTDGILDKEFATLPMAEWGVRLTEGKCAIFTNDIDQVVPGYQGNYENMKSKKGIYWVYCPPLKQYPASLKDPRYTWGYNTAPINASHRIAIAAKTRYPNESWKVLEGFSTDALRQTFSIGREGKEYNMVGGKRVPTDRLYFHKLDDADSQYWTIHLQIIRGSWPTEERYAFASSKVPAEDWKRIHESSRPVHEWAVKNGVPFAAILRPIPEVTKVTTESRALISAIIAKTIMGEFSMEDFDAQVKLWTDKYGFQDDLWTKAINENKDMLRKAGVKSVDW